MATKTGKVFLLRHERRKNSIAFESSLTPRGLKNAKEVVCPQLEQLNIGSIYCSPFIRTLQTIAPFCQKTGKKVNIEWSLVESYPSKPKIPEEFASIINTNYNSFISYKYPENYDIITFELLKQRAKTFIESLDRTKNVLLVSHMPVINAVLSYKGFEFIEMYTHHHPGSLLS